MLVQKNRPTNYNRETQLMTRYISEIVHQLFYSISNNVDSCIVAIGIE